MCVIIQGKMDDPKLSPSNTLKNGLQIGIAIKWRGYMHNRQPRIQFSGSNNASGGLGYAIPCCHHLSGLLEMKNSLVTVA